MSLAETSPLIGVYKRLLVQIGNAAVNSMYPNDFEFYMCALELTDSNDSTMESFIFPIMPDNITEVQTPIQNIKKTFGGITTLSSGNFVPNDISLKGNFGRKFKFLVGSVGVDAAAFSFVNKKFQYNKNAGTFSNQLKTGYGCLKVLERMCAMSNALDDFGNPYRLYFYNMALGNHYLVKVINFTPDMSMDSNMIWKYSLNMKAVAPIIGRKKTLKSSLTSLLKKAILMKAISATAAVTKQELKLATYK